MRIRKNKKKPVVLIILDGFGYSLDTYYNAVYQAKKPNLNRWMCLYPYTTLFASGKYVGLLPGYIGNSEVGHITIGAGRIEKQPVSLINKAIEDKKFFSNKVLVKNLKKVKNIGGRLHLMGLLSDAGVHSHIKQLFAFLLAAKKTGIKDVYVHVFLDGRDVGPKTASKYIKELEDFMKKHNIGILASLHGRFYAMDRDKNWERIKKTYAILTNSSGISGDKKIDWHEVLDKNYKNGITDEFIVPELLVSQGVIRDGDGVIFFNFRPDRARQLTKVFVDKMFDQFKKKKLNLCCFITPVSYNSRLHTDTMFEIEPISNTLKDALCAHSKTMFTIAETEKYAHVTYFFNGGREKPYDLEEQVLIESIKAKDYTKNPCMSAKKITQNVIHSLKTDPKDFYLINYANADMVGHSGDFEATCKAIACMDTELKKLYDIVIQSMDGTMYITADHGNAEQMVDKETGQPHTAHTSNPVPFIFIKKGLENTDMKLPLHQLADIAPFILKNMGLEIPKEMR